MHLDVSQLRKHFRLGDHVKVLKGQHEGDTGLVLRVEENLIIFFSDLTMHEVRERKMKFLFIFLLFLRSKFEPMIFNCVRNAQVASIRLATFNLVI